MQPGKHGAERHERHREREAREAEDEDARSAFFTLFLGVLIRLVGHRLFRFGQNGIVDEVHRLGGRVGRIGEPHGSSLSMLYPAASWMLD